MPKARSSTTAAPPTRHGGSRARATAPPRRSGAIRIGVGGWTFAPWRGTFYPAGLAQREELAFASGALTAIEVNGTFYAAQKPATYARWRAETPDGFVFSLKAPRYATVRRKLGEAGRAVHGFLHGGLAELGDRLGPVNWQLPPTTAFDPDDLAAFLDLLPEELDGLRLRHVLEVRHPGFRCPGYLELARARGIATVFTDSGVHPSFADLTAGFVYARLMRSEASRAAGYPPAALDAWAQRLRTWATGGEPDDLPRVLPPASASKVPRDVFVFFIGAAKVRNPAAAEALIARVAGQSG
jgi:uncharacterized protein YecE (DUF72 family)